MASRTLWSRLKGRRTMRAEALHVARSLLVALSYQDLTAETRAALLADGLAAFADRAMKEGWLS